MEPLIQILRDVKVPLLQRFISLLKEILIMYIGYGNIIQQKLIITLKKKQNPFIGIKT